MNIPELPLTVGLWLGALFFLMAGLNQVANFMDRFREKPTPSETYLKVQDHLRIEAAEAARIDRLEQHYDELQKKLSGDVRGVHERIERLETKIGEMPDRLVALLANSKSIAKPS
jgi:hypothetical protein